MSKVRGRFRDVDGRIDISPTLTDCVAVTMIHTYRPHEVSR